MKKFRGLAIFCSLVLLAFQLTVPGQGGDAEIFKFKFKPGQPLYYRMTMDMDIGMDIKVAERSVKTDMVIKIKWTIKLTPQNKTGDPTLLDMETTNLEVDWNIGTPQGQVKAAMRGDHVFSTLNGNTVIDTKKGIGLAQAKVMSKELEPLKMKGQIEMFTTGRHGKIIGDPKFVKFWTEGLEGQVSFFGLFFTKDPVAVGESFHEYLFLKKIGQLTLQEPGLQCKVLVSRLPDKTIAGRTFSAFKISAPFLQQDLTGSIKVGAQKMKVDILEFKRDAAGNALFDNKKGTLIDSQLDIKAMAKMKLASGTQSALMDMDMKITLDIRKVDLKELYSKPAAR